MSGYNNENQNQWKQAPENGSGKDPLESGTRRPGNGFSAVSMICGISGILCLCGFAFPLAILLGVGAVCSAVVSRQGQPFSAAAVFGLVLGIIAVILGVGEFLYLMALSSIIKDPANAAAVNQFLEQLGRQLQQGRPLPTV